MKCDCSSCVGMGWFGTTDRGSGERVHCPACKGSGLARLTATDVAAWLIDRAEQFDTGSGVDMELVKLARAVMTGELHAAIAHGELDDPKLVRRVLGMKR